MPAKDTGTEQLIKDTAKRIFFAEGRLHATTQDIADAAGVNRAALHYYFRTRDQLIETVWQEAMLALSQRLGEVMGSSRSFRQKIEVLVEVFMTDMMQYPYQEPFLVTEINQSGERLLDKIDLGSTRHFLAEIEAEIAAGRIAPMHPAQFLMNLFSLLSYPLIMAPLYRKLFQLSAHDFDQLMLPRKKMILRMLFQ